MGDGQHMWAACEWAMMVRNCFIREDSGRLVIGSGLRPEWWQGTGAIFGPTLTPFGPATVRIAASGAGAIVQVDGTWRDAPPVLEVRVPGFAIQTCTATASQEFRLSLSP